MQILPPYSSRVKKVEIISLYQPLYSVHEKKYIGVEALSRGRYRGIYLSASELFNLPGNREETHRLNSKCIHSALSGFSEQSNHENFSIFLNIDSSLMDCRTGIYEDLKEIISETGISPDRIVIELIESRVGDFDSLLQFAKCCRDSGFLIALDDVGAGYSSLERIVKIKPDIIKIDRELVRGVSEEFHKKEVCRSIIGLARHIGALSLAEGVETIQDALECQDLGADLMQGFYFSKPAENIVPVDISSGKISLLVETWNFSVSERTEIISAGLNKVKKTALKILRRMISANEERWDDILLDSLISEQEIECGYILDSWGKQISESVLNPERQYKNHFLFSPAKAGADHSQKYYFSGRKRDQQWYFSDPYISRATGNICRTVSLMFEKGDSSYFLCLDINS